MSRGNAVRLRDQHRTSRREAHRSNSPQSSEVPSWLEVISVDFAAAMHGGDEKRTTGRGFFTVFGRHREYGTLYLLLYEDISRRAAPIQIVEVDSAVAPDSIERGRTW